jgi:hypothetical protein
MSEYAERFADNDIDASVLRYSIDWSPCDGMVRGTSTISTRKALT